MRQQQCQLHEVFEAIATNREGTKIRGHRYRRRDNLSGDAYQYAFHKSDFDNGENENGNRVLLEQRLGKLLSLLSEQDVTFLCRVFPIGPVSLQQLARESNLSVATWSRFIRQVYADLRDKLFDDETVSER